MAWNNNITPGAPPLLWSNMDEALTKINENFDEIVAGMGQLGLTPVDFGSLDTNVSPTVDNTYSLGEVSTNRWKSLYVAEFADVPGDTFNGVWLGDAHIKGIDYHVELPLGSTIDGEQIKEAFFNSVQVDNENRIEADTTVAPFGETLNLLSGTAIQMVVSSGADSITFNNTGVTSLAGTSGQIGVSGATGGITLTNLGVLSLTNTSTLPSGRTAGAGVAVSGSTGNIAITNTGVLEIQNGFGITVSTDSATGIVTITNSAPDGATFRFVAVTGQSTLGADSTADTLTINPGYGLTVTTVDSTDTINIAVNPNIDIKGSVFGDDSSLLVDGVAGRIVGPVFSNVTGNVTGNLTGNTTGYHYGDVNGSVFSDTSTMLVDGANGMIPAEVVQGTFTGTVIGNVFTSLIDSSDSSAITITPAAVFNSSITVDEDVTVGGNIIVGAESIIVGYLSTAQLKEIVAASTDFADFQIRIAAL